MILYTSDLHFGHENVIRHDGRPFADSDEMDRVLIELWNARVRPDDTVYIVGDLCYRNSRTGGMQKLITLLDTLTQEYEGIPAGNIYTDISKDKDLN